ncbi:TRAP transporter substrate-binding protein [Thermodesulfatator autotrophicus]|uniref:ABC transporter substrate-binding protein n=1 Tax=Thermodesulfatator autotrophicus TaxID=1795632 RepID=A0A177E4A0_9BACT|nr:TRAP transporter substrate-binding protein [Thermodesulfatator autotrophicus]OAG26793.1 ABC transporter substrate-binding protein [Thermodesulfatator autotrophicus]
MDRRTFLKVVGTAGVSSLVAKPVFVHARKRIRWRLVTSWPKSLDVLFGAPQKIAELVHQMTDGLFDIRVYAAGEIVPGLKVLDAVQEGSVPIGHTALYYYTGKHQAFAFACGVPFGLTYRAQNVWLDKSKGGRLLEKLLADFNVVGFPAGNTGAQMGGWFKKPIRSVDDLKGLRFRIPGLGGKVMARLGVSVQLLAGGDIYPALERGAIDGTEWIGPYDDEKLGFYKVAKYYHYPGWWEPSATLHLIVNRKAYESLPKEYQEILKTAAKVANQQMMEEYDAKNPPALKRLLQKGVKLVKFSDEIMTRAQKEAFSLYEELAAKDALYRDIFEDWKNFRGEIAKWFGTAELAINQFLYGR